MEKITRYLQGQQNQLQKGALVKTEESKIHKLTNAQIDALLTKIMDTQSPEHMLKWKPEPRMKFIS